MLITEILDIRETLPVRAINSLVSTLNQNNPEIVQQVSVELILFLNRSLLLYTMANDKAFQKEFQKDFDLWKKHEAKQDLFFKLSNLKSSESNKFIDIISHLKAEIEDKGFINPFSIAILNKDVADFISNVVMQLSLKQNQQVINDQLIGLII